MEGETECYIASEPRGCLVFVLTQLIMKPHHCIKTIKLSGIIFHQSNINSVREFLVTLKKLLCYWKINELQASFEENNFVCACGKNLGWIWDKCELVSCFHFDDILIK